MKKNSPLAAYKTARSILWILLIMSAANVLITLLGSDTYFVFTNFITYLAAVYARVFYDYTQDPVYLVIGILVALVILAVYLLCCLLSKKKRGWLTAALVLFSVDTATMLLYYVIELSLADMLSDILDFACHGLVLWALIAGVRRSRDAMAEADAPEPLPMNTEFYDASQGDVPNTPALGQPTDKKHRVLLSAVYGSHEIEVRRSYGLTELIVDGKVYGREEGVVESGYAISARVGGHAIETEFTPGGKQILRVDGQVIAKKQRLF